MKWVSSKYYEGDISKLAGALPYLPGLKEREGGRGAEGGGYAGLVKSESKKVIVVTNDVQKNNSINNV